MDWGKLWKNKTIVSVEIIEAVNAGFIGLLQGEKVFMPYSQTHGRVGDEVDVAITTPPCGSRLAVASEEWARRDAVLRDLATKKGRKHFGHVTTVTDFGLFIELEGLGIEGLVKTEVRLEVGEEVEVRPYFVDFDKQRVCLTL